MSREHIVQGMEGPVTCVHPSEESVSQCSMKALPMPNLAPLQTSWDDPVKHPSHYMLANGIECIQVVQEFNFNRGGAIKYVWRAGKKSTAHEIEDLEKARELLTFEIERLRNV